MKKQVKNREVIIMMLVMLTTMLSAVMFEQDYGARAGGVAGSFSSLADDVDAIMWNPAGLSNVTIQEFNFMYGKPFAGFADVDLGYQYLSYARKVDRIKGVVGIAWSGFNDSDVYKQEIIACSISRLVNPKKNLSLGLTIKYLGHKFNFSYLDATDPVRNVVDNKYAIGIDGGIMVNLKPNIKLGAVIRNLNEPDIGILETDTIPTEIRFGLNISIFSKLRFEELKPVVEMKVEKDKTSISAGVEGYLANKSLVLRAGFNDYETTLGFGWYRNVRNFILKIDYAYIMHSQMESTGGSHKISMGIKL